MRCIHNMRICNMSNFKFGHCYPSFPSALLEFMELIYRMWTLHMITQDWHRAGSIEKYSSLMWPQAKSSARFVPMTTRLFSFALIKFTGVIPKMICDAPHGKKRVLWMIHSVKFSPHSAYNLSMRVWMNMPPAASLNSCLVPLIHLIWFGV